MYTFLYLILFSLAGLKTFSQQPYFVYIQSDERQVFYVRLDDKIYSSTTSGYLIISNLEDRNINVLLGFPKNIYPEQRFQLSLNKKDKGFLLKQVDNKNWQLVNLQGQAVINNTGAVIANNELSGVKKTDPFSVMLANVVNDSSILYPQNKPEIIQTVAQKPAKVNPEKKERVTEADAEAEALVRKEATENTTALTKASKEDSSEVVVKFKEPTAPPQNEKKALPVVTKEEKTALAEKPFISKIKEERTATGYKATYLEQYNYTTDTIDVTIPAEVTTVNKIEEPVTREQEVASKDVATAAPPKNEMINKDSSRSVVLQIGSITDTFNVKTKIIMINSDCKSFASENDVDKLRIRLMAEKNIDDQLTAARKYYKNKCFTVQQIRALTELFPSDEMKYRFIDLSYAFASDSGNFYLLEEVMTEAYYKNRFKAMIRK